MKVFSRTYLPESINYNKRLYVREREAKNSEFTLKYKEHPQGRRFVVVNVLAKNLRGGRLNLHNKPYDPTRHVYINN